MANSISPMSFLPTIKCSCCGVDIEIAFLADHVCASETTLPHAPINPLPPKTLTPGHSPARHDRYRPTRTPSPKSRYDSQQLSPSPRSVRLPQYGRSTRGEHEVSTRGNLLDPNSTSNSAGFLKPGRSVPPRIDPAAANRSFPPVALLTPESSYSGNSDTRSVKSVSPSTQLISPMSVTSRKTGNLSRSPSPPSPELQSNLDSAFPPFPFLTPQPVQNPSPINTKLRPALLPGDKALMAPLSPQINGGADVAKRVDILAPGPFTGARRGLPESVVSPKQDLRMDTLSAGVERSVHDARVQEQFPRPSTAQSHKSHQSTISDLSVHQRGFGAETTQRRAAPPRPLRPTGNVNTLLEQPQTDGGPSRMPGYTTRSQNFPELGARTAVPLRSQRDLEPHFDPAVQPGFDYNTISEPVRFADLSPSPDSFEWGQATDDPPRPPISNSTRFPPGEILESELPPVPGVFRQDSDRSVESKVSHATSHSSSTTYSAASSRASTRASSQSGRSSGVAQDFERTRSSTRSVSESRRKRSDTANSARSQSVGISRRYVAPEPPVNPWSAMPESPIDPAIQRGLEPPRKQSTWDRLPRETPLQQGEYPSRPRQESLSSRGDYDLLTPGISQRSKATCQACQLPIYGKSVKTADGRLPGRYHKSCFVCRTCAAPFPTGEFYVLDNSPYCAQHYHQLNGSCCSRCNVGIEGQYLETDAALKFHPSCFGCTKCAVELPEDYFEVDGQPYCQRHAFAFMRAAALGDAPRVSPERRRTRLMLM